jgi:16S rRNA (adenine1518-N6/adenine1519-N6)-dimethyltransferase
MSGTLRASRLAGPALRKKRFKAMAAPRQTQSYLRGLFAQRGISPQRRLGQNFLIDLNIHKLIGTAAQAAAGDVILEVGSGTGALTSLLAGSGAALVAVDIDPAMAALTAEAVNNLSNVTVINCDVLKSKSSLDPLLLDAVRSALAGKTGKSFKLVANLPYQVATPVITNLLVHPELCPVLMVVTIQRELAQRLCAAPASSSYGAVSAVAQALADVSILRSLPPAAFWPRPKVDSAVVAILPSPRKRAAVGDVAWFHELVRRVFLHRRKYLRHQLAEIWRDRWTAAEADHWLESHGLCGQIRAEVLSVPEFVALAGGLRARFGELPQLAARTTTKHDQERGERDFDR